VETLTASEYLRFSIKFIYKIRITNGKIETILNQLLLKFRLNSCKDVIIGSARLRDFIHISSDVRTKKNYFSAVERVSQGAKRKDYLWPVPSSLHQKYFL